MTTKDYYAVIARVLTWSHDPKIHHLTSITEYNGWKIMGPSQPLVVRGIYWDEDRRSFKTIEEALGWIDAQSS